MIFGAALGALVVGLGAPTKTTFSSGVRSNAAEPMLSYELDRLLRAPRRPATIDITNERDEAGRILLTSAGHSGMSPDDRAYLVQMVGGLTGLPPADAERRVDDAVTRSQTAIHNARRTAVILAFSAAATLLVGSVVAWAAAVAGGRHRDGEPLPRWMSHGEYLTRRRSTPLRGVAPTSTPLPD